MYDLRTTYSLHRLKLTPHVLHYFLDDHSVLPARFTRPVDCLAYNASFMNAIRFVFYYDSIGESFVESGSLSQVMKRWRAWAESAMSQRSRQEVGQSSPGHHQPPYTPPTTVLLRSSIARNQLKVGQLVT